MTLKTPRDFLALPPKVLLSLGSCAIIVSRDQKNRYKSVISLILYLCNQMEINQKLLSLKQVVALVGLAKSTIYRLMNSGDFPRPLKLGSRCVRWLVDDLNAWISNLPSAA